jgi:hypothetical protein
MMHKQGLVQGKWLYPHCYTTLFACIFQIFFFFIKVKQDIAILPVLGRYLLHLYRSLKACGVL